MTRKAVLALANGQVFEGVSIGAAGQAAGEVVFNTAITGYQEILTDPSYARQIITLTHPHIGNTGVNDEDEESRAIWASGLIVRDVPRRASNYRMQQTLSDYLAERGIVGIAGIDTRRLTGVLRDEGSQPGCVSAVASGAPDVDAALAAARAFPGLAGMDLAKEVTTDASYTWREGTWAPGTGFRAAPEMRFRVVAIDFGVKRNILRLLTDRGCELTVVPATTPVEAILDMAPDGVFLSNGPGDPDPCDYAITTIAALLERKIPLFGICLGLQLLGLAAGMKSKKMGHGHHGANHPVQNLRDGTVLITSQNHGFCLDEDTIGADVEVTHRSLFDDTLQGIELRSAPAFGFQGHPEASPGPHDAEGMFDHFIDLMVATNEAGNRDA